MAMEARSGVARTTALVDRKEEANADGALGMGLRGLVSREGHKMRRRRALWTLAQCSGLHLDLVRDSGPSSGPQGR